MWVCMEFAQVFIVFIISLGVGSRRVFISLLSCCVLSNYTLKSSDFSVLGRHTILFPNPGVNFITGK